jgi:hypothetical protein
MRKTIQKALAAVLPILAFTGVVAESDTVISESIFRLNLPGKWSGGYNAESRTWSYATPSKKESVTVGILERTTGPALAAVKSDFEVYLKTRRAQEQQLGGPRLSLTKSRIREVPGAMLSRHDDYDPSNGRRTHTYVIVNERAAASYYYEAFGMSEAEFNKRAAVVLAQVGLIR